MDAGRTAIMSSLEISNKIRVEVQEIHLRKKWGNCDYTLMMKTEAELREIEKC